MDTLKINLQKFKNSIDEFGLLLEKLRRYSSTSKMVLGGGAIISILSVLTLTKWVSVPIILTFTGIAFCYIQKNYSLESRFDEIHLYLKEMNESVVVLQEDSCAKDEKIVFLKSQINRIRSSYDTDPIEVVKTKTELDLVEILKKIQRLDYEVEDFGPECASYMRKEFSKTLKVCDLKFVDYSEEERMLFATETADIDNVDCTSRAIVTISSPTKIVLKGHAFIPKTVKT